MKFIQVYIFVKQFFNKIFYKEKIFGCFEVHEYTFDSKYDGSSPEIDIIKLPLEKVKKFKQHIFFLQKKKYKEN